MLPDRGKKAAGKKRHRKGVFLGSAAEACTEKKTFSPNRVGEPHVVSLNYHERKRGRALGGSSEEDRADTLAKRGKEKEGGITLGGKAYFWQEGRATRTLFQNLKGGGEMKGRRGEKNGGGGSCA